MRSTLQQVIAGNVLRKDTTDLLFRFPKSSFGGASIYFDCAELLDGTKLLLTMDAPNRCIPGFIYAHRMGSHMI